VLVVESRLTGVFMTYIMLKEMNIIGSNSNSLFFEFYMLKYENSTLKIYIRTIIIKHYIDIDPAVDFVFPVNKIDRENSGKK